MCVSNAGAGNLSPRYILNIVILARCLAHVENKYWMVPKHMFTQAEGTFYFCLMRGL